MSKRDKQRGPERRGAGLSSLRPRLDQLLRSERLGAMSQQEMYEELDRLIEGIKPALFLPTIVSAALHAPEAAQARLDALLPDWLSERGHVAALGDLVTRELFDDQQRQRALAWLSAAGADTADLLAEIEGWDPFYAAFSAGNEMQAALMIFWYTSRRQQRVQGLSLLLDFQPPWDGAVKDAMRYPQRAPAAALEEFVHVWDRRGAPATPLTAVEAKCRVLEALVHNRESKIRLHSDLIAARDLVVRSLLNMPDGPDTPPFTEADFDFLSSHGERAETLQRQEQRFGYRTRAPDGREIHIIRGPDEDEW
jgi:hypothetical protein